MTLAKRELPFTIEGHKPTFLTGTGTALSTRNSDPRLCPSPAVAGLPGWQEFQIPQFFSSPSHTRRRLVPSLLFASVWAHRPGAGGVFPFGTGDHAEEKLPLFRAQDQ